MAKNLFFSFLKHTIIIIIYWVDSKEDGGAIWSTKVGDERQLVKKGKYLEDSDVWKCGDFPFFPQRLPYLIHSGVTDFKKIQNTL